MSADLLPAKFSEMTRTIERMTTTEDGLKALAMADAMAAYAKRIKASTTTMNAVVVFRMRAERKFGEIIDRMPKNQGAKGLKGGGTRNSKKVSRVTKPPTYKELGIPPKVASRAQCLAQVPQSEFEKVLIVEDGGELNENRITKLFTEHRQRATRKAKRTAAAQGTPLDERIIIGDFRKHAHRVADGSVSLIFTDPPYDRQAEKLFPGLADFAAAKLADGGSLLMYVGHLQLPAVFAAFESKLRHWWTCACVHQSDQVLMREYGVRVGWKPMLWFVKGTRDDKSAIVFDTVAGGREKDNHDWQQAESEAGYYIGPLCPEDGIVCDPFLGGGTTASAAIKLCRKWIGFEIDPETAAIASKRISA